MGKVEYRMNQGNRRLEMAADGRTVLPVTDQIANLRALGCPEHIAAKVERSAIERRARQAMAVGTVEPTGPTAPSFSDLRAKATEIGNQIADDNKKFREQEAMHKRLKSASGRISG